MMNTIYLECKQEGRKRKIFSVVKVSELFEYCSCDYCFHKFRFNLHVIYGKIIYLYNHLTIIFHLKLWWLFFIVRNKAFHRRINASFKIVFRRINGFLIGDIDILIGRSRFQSGKNYTPNGVVLLLYIN